MILLIVDVNTNILSFFKKDRFFKAELQAKFEKSFPNNLYKLKKD